MAIRRHQTETGHQTLLEIGTNYHLDHTLSYDVQAVRVFRCYHDVDVIAMYIIFFVLGQDYSSLISLPQACKVKYRMTHAHSTALNVLCLLL